MKNEGVSLEISGKLASTLCESRHAHRVEVGRGVVLNYLRQSIESDFYDTMYRHSSSPKPELCASVKQGCPDAEFVQPIVRSLVARLAKLLPPDAVVVELGGGVYQRRSGYLSRIFGNYVPLDISLSSIERYAEQFGRVGIACDATQMPFRDGSVDAVFSRTFLEHPREPEKVLREIVRCTKPGAVIIHYDAWFCRWWSRFGVVGLKKYSNMTFREKAIYIASRFTECPFLRYPPIILRRFCHESMCPRSPVHLPYRRLIPNYDLYLGCDEDASSSLDPLDVIRFYEANGFHLVDSLSFWQRIFLGSVPVVMQRHA
jgi:ubiquinone/menaquinone biosynthesis C-methylase UbiE